jgi:hypothetical protein
METDTLQEAQRLASHNESKSDAVRAMARREGMLVVEQRLTEVEERHLSGIPVLDEEVSDGLRCDELPIIAFGPAESKVMVPVRESAPVSVRGRLALAREMLLRASQELDTIAREASAERVRSVAGEVADAVHQVKCLLDEELADEEL